MKAHRASQALDDLDLRCTRLLKNRQGKAATIRRILSGEIARRHELPVCASHQVSHCPQRHCRNRERRVDAERARDDRAIKNDQTALPCRHFATIRVRIEHHTEFIDDTIVRITADRAAPEGMYRHDRAARLRHQFGELIGNQSPHRIGDQARLAGVSAFERRNQGFERFVRGIQLIAMTRLRPPDHECALLGRSIARATLLAQVQDAGGIIVSDHADQQAALHRSLINRHRIGRFGTSGAVKRLVSVWQVLKHLPGGDQFVEELTQGGRNRKLLHQKAAGLHALAV